MTEEQVIGLIVGIDIQLTHFIPQDFKNTIRKTKEYRCAINNIIGDAYYYITGGKILPLHEYDDLIKSEIERLTRQEYNASH